MSIKDNFVAKKRTSSNVGCGKQTFTRNRQIVCNFGRLGLPHFALEIPSLWKTIGTSTFLRRNTRFFQLKVKRNHLATEEGRILHQFKFQQTTGNYRNGLSMLFDGHKAQQSEYTIGKIKSTLAGTRQVSLSVETHSYNSVSSHKPWTIWKI